MRNLTTPTTQEIEWAKKIADFARSYGDDTAVEEISNAISEYSNRKITVAVIGLNKRGKSTFCNAFLGRKDDILAPVNWEPATGVISSFQNSSSKECAIVHFEDGHVQETEYEQIQDFVLEQKNPQNKKNVEYVEVLGRFDLDDDIALLDLPGDDSIHAYHSQIIYDYLPNADVILFLSSATKPIQKNELSLLSQVAEDDRKKIFFIINKADECDEDELMEAKEKDLGVLKNAEISYGEKVFCISAKQIMTDGKDNYEFDELLSSIHTFLDESKIKLQRTGFRNIVCNAVSGLLEKLEIYADSSKLSNAELQQKIDDLNQEYAHTKEMLDHGLDEFSQNWENMISSLERQLPELETEVQSEVENYIQDIPMMSLTGKVVQSLPEKITEIVNSVLETPLSSLKVQVDASLNKLDQHMKSIDKYLSDSVYNVHSTSSINNHVGSIVAGGTFIGLGSALASLASIPATWAGITIGGFNIGAVFAAIGGAATLPLTVIASPLLLGGSLFLGLPILGWVRGKKRQKIQIITSARNSITQAFCTMRTSKLPLMRQQGDILVTKLKGSFNKKMTQTQQALDEALSERTHMISNNEKSTSDLRYLANLVAK